MAKLFPCPTNIVLGFITTNPKFDPFSKHRSFPISHRSFRCCATTTTAAAATTTASESESDTTPFAVSYLINNFGFSHESALKAFNSKKVRFKSPENPNSVINFFLNNGFSHHDIAIIIKKEPWLLSSKPDKTLLPKFQFFLSNGVTSNYIVILLTANPEILQYSLEKRLIPLFELLSRFLKTNQAVIVFLIRNSSSFTHIPYDLIADNINLMTDFGVCNNSIAELLYKTPSMFGSTDLIKSLEEVKGLGFDPSMTTFAPAFIAKKCMTKKFWKLKFDALKKWGWSKEDVLSAFQAHPNFIFTSSYKIDSVMSVFVNQFGLDSLALSKYPLIFCYSMKRRIIPRASILQYLSMKGLLKKRASLFTPFILPEKDFLDKFVFKFKRESDYLIKLYEEKMKRAYTKGHKGTQWHATH